MADPTPLSNKAQIGDVISQAGADGVKRYKQYAGNGQWNDIPPPVGKTIGSSVRALTPNEEKALEDRKKAADAAQSLNITNKRAINASNELQSGPWRGKFLDMAIPDPGDGGFWDTLGAGLIGVPAQHIFGAIGQKDIQNYQTVKRAENEAVSAKQLPQKGSQTESDAQRYAMTGLRVGNDPQQNRLVAAQDEAANAYLQAKRNFELNWANKYGVYGPNEAGQDMTTAFQAQYKPPIPEFKRETQYSAQHPEGVTIIRTK
jgi:hypothetical protein